MKKILTTLICFFFFSFIFILTSKSHAETYPSQPIQMVITLAPGDGLDLTGRAIASELSKNLSTPIIPINKTGGGGTIGADFVAKSKKDGYTMLFINSNIIYTYATNPENVPYNPFQDLEPLCQAVSIPLLIAVRADSPWKTFQELIEYMKQNPGKIRGSSTGVGSVGHFGYEIIRIVTGQAINMIPYKGASPGLVAMLGGHVEVAIPAWSLVASHLKAGKVRVLLTSKKIPDLPDVPTLKQLGYKYDMSSVWFGFFLPSGVPESIKGILLSNLEKSIKSQEVNRAFQNIGAFEDYKPPSEFRKMMIEEYEMVKGLFKTSPSK